MIFDIINTLQGKFVIAGIVLVLFSLAQSFSANKNIDEYNKRHHDDYRVTLWQRAPTWELIIVLILLLAILIMPVSLFPIEE